MYRRAVLGTLFMFLLAASPSLSFWIRPVMAQEDTVVRVLPDTLEFGPENSIGREFAVAVVVENVTRLAGIDIRFGWNTTYLEYVNHTATLPIEEYPDPIPPSPYSGILREPIHWIRDSVNTTAGTYRGAFVTLGTPSFNGSGTVFVITLQVIDQPGLGEKDVVLELHLISTDLAEWGGQPISHETIDGAVTLRALIVMKQTLVFFNVNPNPIGVGQNTTLNGLLLDQSPQPLPNEAVELYARPLTGLWRPVASLTTGAHGAFEWEAAIPIEGTFIFAAYYPGSETYEATYNFAVLIVQ